MVRNPLTGGFRSITQADFACDPQEVAALRERLKVRMSGQPVLQVILPEQMRSKRLPQQWDHTISVPGHWRSDFVQCILDNVQRMATPPNALRWISPADAIRSTASRANMLPRLNSTYHNRYQPALAVLKWNHCLAGLTVYLEAEDDEDPREEQWTADAHEALRLTLPLLVDTLAHAPADLASKRNNTLALLFSHPATLRTLYCELAHTWSSPAKGPAHLDLEQLPEHALFAALTVLKPENGQCDAVLDEIEDSLKHFTVELQARVLAGLWAYAKTAEPDRAPALLSAITQLGKPNTGTIDRFVKQFQTLSDVLDAIEGGEAAVDAPPPSELLDLLADLHPGTVMYRELLEQLAILHSHRPFNVAELLRLKIALTRHLQLLIRFTHPNASETPLALELMRLDSPLIAQLFLELTLEEQLQLFCGLAPDEVCEQIARFRSATRDDEQWAFSMRSTIVSLTLADELGEERRKKVREALNAWPNPS